MNLQLLTEGMTSPTDGLALENLVLPTRPAELVDNITVDDVAPVQTKTATTKSSDTTYLEVNLPNPNAQPQAEPLLTPDQKKYAMVGLAILALLIVIMIIRKLG